MEIPRFTQPQKHGDVPKFDIPPKHGASVQNIFVGWRVKIIYSDLQRDQDRVTGIPPR